MRCTKVCYADEAFTGIELPNGSLQNFYSKTAGSKHEWHLPVYKSRSSLDRWQYLTQVVFHQRTLRLGLLLANLIRPYGRHKTLNYGQTLIKFTAKIAQFTDPVLVRKSVGHRNWLEISSSISLIRRQGNVIKVKRAGVLNNSPSVSFSIMSAATNHSRKR